MNLPKIDFTSLSNITSLENLLKKPEKSEGSNAFESVFQSYLDILNETSKTQINAEQLQIDYATNKTDDILAVTLAQQKASTSLNFAVQVTNKIISSYQEIMRIAM